MCLMVSWPNRGKATAKDDGPADEGSRITICCASQDINPRTGLVKLVAADTSVKHHKRKM